MTLKPLKVMTFNLRYASPSPPNSWAQRHPVVSECLRLTSPDVIGTQEGLYSQLKDIAMDQPEYDWIGMGRDGGNRGEFMAVFYRKERLEPMAFDHFWLSDTPEVIGSRTWGPTLARMVTWVRFRNRQNGQEFCFINTHLDNAVQLAREKGAALIVQRAKIFDPALPILLVGDFNAVARQSTVYDILTGEGGFSDTWLSARQRRGQDVATAHSYKPAVPEGPHIDWILSRGPLAVQETEVVTFQRDGQYPSDHFPVVATVDFNISGRQSLREEIVHKTMSRYEMQALLEYDVWATQKLLEAVQTLTAEQFTREFAEPGLSIREQCVHALRTWDHYRARLLGEEPPEEQLKRVATPRDLVTYAEQVHRRAHDFWFGLGDEMLHEYRDLSQTPGASRVMVAAVLYHVVNHGTFHRGEIAALLKLQGVEFSDTDFITWARQ